VVVYRRPDGSGKFEGIPGMRARIFKPAKTAMQSGRAKTRRWRLEFEAESPRTIDSLMGWTSSADTKAQVSLSFGSRDAAVAYAKKHGIDYTVLPERPRKRQIKTYSDNFR
jgi:hypothetical protein